MKIDFLNANIKCTKRTRLQDNWDDFSLVEMRKRVKERIRTPLEEGSVLCRVVRKLIFYHALLFLIKEDNFKTDNYRINKHN